MTQLEKYIIARWAYGVGQDIMDDPEYDALENSLFEKGIGLEYMERSWSTDICPSELLQKYGYQHLIIDQLYSNEKSSSMQSITELDLALDFYSQFAPPYHLGMKVDGWNMQSHYLKKWLRKFNTRGRTGDEMQVATHILPASIDTDKEYVRIYGEAALSRTNFRKLQELTNHRDLVSNRASVSSARAHHPELLSYLAFNFEDETLTPSQKYEQLEAWGFQTPMYISTDDLEEGIRFFSSMRSKYDFKADGIVVQPDHPNCEHLMRAVRVLNFSRKLYTSTVIGYEQKHSKHYYGLKLRINPTQTEDAGSQKLVDIDNPGRIVRLGLEIGSSVVFTKVSDATEKIEESATLDAHKGDYYDL